MKLLSVGCLFVLPLVIGKLMVIQSNQIIPTTQTTPADDLVGDWKLSLETYDDNHNKKLEEDERKKGFSNHYFYRFSADGSCIISPFVTNQLKNGFKGHYVVNEKNGKKILTTYWDEAEQKGQREAQYTIVSVNKDELVLLETTGDHTFWIFKRVG
jgi:hypothetical protein